ncbi:MAG: dipeptidase [Pirellulaceae bacterium]
MLLVLSCGLLALFTGPVCGEDAEDPPPTAARIHEQVLTIDTHVDTSLRLVGKGFDLGVRHDASAPGGRVDLPRMKEGGLDAIFFAVYLGQGERTAAGNEHARQQALQIFDAIHESIAHYPDLAVLATTSDAASRAEAEGKRAIYIGIENGYVVGNDLSLLKTYYDLGARYITLCHARNNDICDSSTDDQGPEHQGLSAFGRQVVQEMNRLGMMVDVSHASDETVYDVLEISWAPVIASHSCARALCDNPRNVSDDLLLALAKNGGVIQICILDAYLKSAPPNPDRDKAVQELRDTYGEYEKLAEDQRREVFEKWEEINRQYPQSDASVADVVDHIDHVVKTIGIDYVGIGTDFDGGGGIADCCDVSQMENITRELVRRGYTQEQIGKIWSGNFLRVFRQVERWAQHASQTIQPGQPLDYQDLAFYPERWQEAQISTELIPTAMLALRKDYGGDAWVARFFRYLQQCPEISPDTEADALAQSLNWLVAASCAARKDLTPVFVDRWRMPLDPATREALCRVDWTSPSLDAAQVIRVAGSQVVTSQEE